MVKLKDLLKLCESGSNVIELLVGNGFNENEFRIDAMFSVEYISYKGARILCTFDGDILMKKKYEDQVCHKYDYLPKHLSTFMAVPDNLTFDEMLADISLLIEIDKKKKQRKKEGKKRIRHMMNFNHRHEAILNRVGILDRNELITLGSVGTVRRLLLKDKEVSLRTLAKIEGAIQGKHWSLIDESWMERAKKSLHPYSLA